MAESDLTKEERELANHLKVWVVNRLQEILCFTAPEHMRVKLLGLLVDVQNEAIEDERF